jgi:myosin heavy subunit
VSAKSTWTPSPETMHRQKIELDFDIKMTRKRISAQKKIHDLQKRIDNLIENEKQTTKDIETRHDDLMKTNRNLKKKMDTDLEKTKKELQESKKELQESKKELHRIHEQQRKSIREQYTYEDLKKDALKRLQETYKIQNELEYELSVLLKKKQDTNVELNTLLENKNTVEHHKRNSKPSPRSKKKQTISKPAKRRPRVDPVLANTGLTGTYWDYKNTKRSTKRREM